MNHWQYLTRHEFLHALVAAGLSVGVWWWFRSSTAAIVCFLVSMLADSDHFLDYLLFTQFERMSLREGLRGPQFAPGNRIVLFWHSYEWVLGLTAAALLHSGWRALAAGAAIGLMGQIVIDQFSYGGAVLRFSILYRALHGFRFEAFVGQP